MSIKLALAQMDVRLGDPQANLARAADWTAAAARTGSQLVLFPELWASGYDLENWRRHAHPIGEGLFAETAALAAEHGLAVGGSLLEHLGEAAANTFALYGPDASAWGLYRKAHRFAPMGEDRWLKAGDRRCLAQTPWGPAGLAICYDLRFPELFRAYALQGAVLVLLVAEWPAARLDHWRTLVRARAIENQLFVAAVNRTGTSNGEDFGGGSLVVDPWGEVVGEAGHDEVLLPVEIDLGRVDQVRRRMPVLEDRRPEVYET